MSEQLRFGSKDDCKKSGRELPAAIAGLRGGLQERFRRLLDQRLQALDSQTEKNREQAVSDVINVFRALMTGPLVVGSHPNFARNDYARVVEITGNLNLSWSAMDATSIPPEQAADVAALQKILFDPERSLPTPKKIGMFGALSVNSLEEDYASSGEW